MTHKSEPAQMHLHRDRANQVQGQSQGVLSEKPYSRENQGKRCFLQKKKPIHQFTFFIFFAPDIK